MSEFNIKAVLLRLAKEEFRSIDLVLDGPASVTGITGIEYNQAGHDVLKAIIDIPFPKEKSELYIRVSDISCISVTR